MAQLSSTSGLQGVRDIEWSCIAVLEISIFHISTILSIGFWKCGIVFHFIVAFLIISPYLEDYNYDNNIMLSTSFELLLEVIIIIIRVIKVSVTNIFSIFFFFQK